MPVLSPEQVSAQVHADNYDDQVIDIHIRSTRSNPLSGAGAATLTRNGPWAEPVPNPLPTGCAAFIPEAVEIADTSVAGPFLMYEAVLLGSIDCATGVFTDGVPFPTRKALGITRQLSGQVLVEMATDQVSQRTITVTYVNQDGVGGRTSAAHTITLAALQDSTGILVLQVGDTGVQDITNVTATGGTAPSGTINFWGIIPIIVIPPGIGLGGFTVNLLAEGVVRRLEAGATIRFLQLNSQAASRSIGALRYVYDTAGAALAGNKNPLLSVANLMENQAAFGELAVGLNVRHTPATASGGPTAGFHNVQCWDRDYVVPALGAGIEGAVISNYGGHATPTTEQVLVWKTVMGTLTVAGNSFSAGSAMPSRKHLGRTAAEQTVAKLPVLYVKTSLSGGTFATVTITYTNQDGVSGRTATVGALPTANPPAGSGYFVAPHLQAGDTGMLSVQGMSVSGVTGGVFELWGCVDLAHEVLFTTAGGANVQVTLPHLPPLLQAGDLLNVLRVNSTTSVGSFCEFDLIGVAA